VGQNVKKMSNLKSAASEFFFIRPNSSEFHPSKPKLLPSQAHLVEHHDNISQLHRQNNRASLLLAHNHSLDHDSYRGGPTTSGQQSIHDQSIIRGNTATRLSSHQSFNGFYDLAGSNQDFPIKPYKKRQQLTGHKSQPQKKPTSTFGSSIVHFFRRVFSKRSKRKAKLAESCSTSLGDAVDDKFESIQRARSAFSTTDGARLDRTIIAEQQQSATKQSQRMIDLIEAFANKTAVNQEAYDKLPDLNVNQTPQRLSTIQQILITQNDAGRPKNIAQRHLHQSIGSPLHKSNSISTSTGLSGLNEMMRMNELHMMMNGQNSPVLFGPRNGPTSLPMITSDRSTKVMSANLTPLYNRKEFHDHEVRNFASPRRSTNLEHLPRPSSIYGQPSMIASPISSNVRDFRAGYFGSYRNSIHSYHQRYDWNAMNHGNDLRRLHPTIKAPILDTTCEVAEEVSSPTTESKTFIDYGSNINRQPVSIDYQDKSKVINESMPKTKPIQQQRRAIVNPILQSPTVSLIYDNHPMPMSSGGGGAYSHYDNHRPIEYQQSMSSMDLSMHSYPKNPGMDVEDSIRRDNNNNFNAIISPLISNRNSKVRQSYHLSNHTNALVTPSHRNSRLPQLQMNHKSSYSPDMEKNLFNHVKPAAMISPSNSSILHAQDLSYTPLHSATGSSLINHSYNPYSQSSAVPNAIVKPSPIKIQQQTYSHYQQSPLVNRQTRVINRGDGVQATITCHEPNFSNGHPEAVINIAGAPDLNVEPSLGQSLLRGTNINAPEASAAELQTGSSGDNTNSKTFTVASSRLSKTVGDEESTAEEARSVNSSRVRQEKSKHDDSLSRSTSSGTDPTSTSSSSKSDLTDKESGSNKSGKKISRFGKSNRSTSSVTGRKNPPSRSSGEDRRRGSSTDHSDELSIHVESFDELAPEERNWVVSKLTQ
jgi:hypothetical protein